MNAPWANWDMQLLPSGGAGADDAAPDLQQLDLLSDTPLPTLAPSTPGGEPLGPGIGSDDSVQHSASGRFWLRGDVLMCACPDCGAPMTVRLWLMVADCWRCEASIELSDEMVEEARQLLRETPPPPPTRRVAPLPPESRPPAPAPPTRAPASTRSSTPRPQPSPASTAAAAHGVRAWIRELLNNMPAWLVSLVFHLILLTLLALLSVPGDDDPRLITLSSRVSARVRDGGDTQRIPPTENSEFDLPIPEFLEMSDPAQRRAMVLADQDARELRLVDETQLPDLDEVRRQISQANETRPSLAVRDPRVRIEMVQREGGTTLTEAAVARGLRWLADHQHADGSWNLKRIRTSRDCRCDDEGTLDSQMAGTSLALLPFLGAGQTHLSGRYRDEVARGLRWMLDQQRPDGDLRGSRGQYPGMYAHGQATIVLCEAFLMTGDENLRVPAQKALDFISEAQYPDGGWRYLPYQQARGDSRLRGDTSVLGWQLMALQSGMSANLDVPEAALEQASHFLDGVQTDAGGLYGYMQGWEPTAPMTAEALLCRVYLGWDHRSPGLTRGIRALLDEYPPSIRQPDYYYWYYGTQVLHHYGGRPWERWNLQMRDILVALQEVRGHEAGSWTPDGQHVDPGGRLYVTSLAVCCLEVYYRHLPIFRQIDLAAE